MVRRSQSLKLCLSLLLTFFCVSFVERLTAQEIGGLHGLNNDPLILAESAEMKKLRMAVEVNISDLKAHEAYLSAFRKRKSPANAAADYKDLEAQYNYWISRYPKNATIPFVLGEFYFRMERAEAQLYLLKTTEIKPDFAEAWFKLGIDAMRLGDDTLVLKYLETAMKADLLNGDYAFQYAYSATSVSRKLSDSLLLDVSKVFHDTEAGARAITELAAREKDLKTKFTRLAGLNLFKKTGGIRYRNAMSVYFSLLINNGNYDTALSLAQRMNGGVVTNKLEWKHKVEVAEQFQQLEAMINAKKYIEAERLLKLIKLNDDFSMSYVKASDKIAAIKETILMGTGRGESILDTLIVKYKKSPSFKLRNQINRYAAQFGKDSVELYQAISASWLEKMKRATDFTLTSYSGEKVALADLKGKVVLLTYWFPGCGPCRGEFPHFENVLQKFDKDRIVYLGINAVAEQDPYVIPFMKSTGFSFTPLKIDKDWDPGNLPAFGYPQNYLIDQQGMIIMSGFMINEDNEDMLELKIKAVLSAK
ncbi:MAG: redoxin domain-containing protein [Bacteroidota bacterium]